MAKTKSQQSVKAARVGKKGVKRNDIIKKYNTINQELKEKYKAENNYKIAYNWKNQTENIKNQRNKKLALRRYDERKKGVGLNRIKPPTQQKTVWVAEGEPYHNILSYGGKFTRAVDNAFSIMTQRGGKVEVIFNYDQTIKRLTGLAATKHLSKNAVNSKMKNLYNTFLELEENEFEDDSMAILGNVASVYPTRGTNYIHVYFFVFYER